MDYAIEQYIPHRSTMKLIDELIEVNDKMASTLVTITEENVFYDDDIQGVYSWVGFEFMAQSIAAFASHNNASAQPAIGLLLSVRNCKSNLSYFKLGQSLIVRVDKIHLEDGVGVFNAAIFSKHDSLTPLQTAKLNTIQPSTDRIHKILTGEIA